MKKIQYVIFIILLFPFSKIHALADLVVSTATTQQTQIDKGDLLVIQATVKNIGNATAASNFMFLYISTDENFIPEELIGRVVIKQLTVGQTQSITFVCSVPTYLVSGNYNVGFRVDPFNDVKEDNENNDFKVKQTVNVTSNVLSDIRLPYPILFVHGLAGNSNTWNDFTNKADSVFGWIYGGRLDYCLNYDNDRSYCSGRNDIKSFVNADKLTKGDYYYVNFDVSTNGVPFVSSNDFSNSQYSNQSAIIKQGWAIKDAVRMVLDITKSEKVILVGHSMGGLASREYLQNKNNWQSTSIHNVAKLLTVATPNGGSNETSGTLLGLSKGIFERSEAVRDLRWKFFPAFSGQYLEGGDENRFLNYWNNDINCDGDENDNITGLNEKTSPSDVNYACILSPNDGIVSAERADLNSYLKPSPPNSSLYADKFSITGQYALFDPYHLKIHKENFKTMVQGLDEPFLFNLAYPIPLNTLSFGFVTEQAPNNPLTAPDNLIDYDDFKIKITQAGTLKLDVFNIPVQTFSAILLNSSYQIVQKIEANGESNITFSKALQAGDYYIEFKATPTPSSYRFPYAFQTVFTPNSGLTANFIANIQDGCTPLTVKFTNQSVGNPTSFSWAFTGGTPATSTSATPQVVYNNAGVYPVSLTVQNAQDNHSVTRNGFINVKSAPNTDFSFSILQNDTVAFSNKTNTADISTTYAWSFGEGGTSTETSPTYKYKSRGAFNVKLAATNICGLKEKILPISIVTNAIKEDLEQSIISIFPNPNDGKFSLTIENKELGEMQISIYNTLGQSIWQNKFQKSNELFTTSISLDNVVKGTYFVKVACHNRFEYRKFIID
jgi:PKD repeat protein/pimeloyl-ACP methyl ester carboxylesterase